MEPSLHPEEGASSDVIEGGDGKTPDMLKGMKNYRQPGLSGDTALPRVLRDASGSYVTLESIQIILCFSAYFFLYFPLKKSFQLLGRKSSTPSFPLTPRFWGVSPSPQEVLWFGPPTFSSSSFLSAHLDAQPCCFP